MLQQLRTTAAGALLTLSLLAPTRVRAVSELPPDSEFCEQVRRGLIVFSDGSNPCADPQQVVSLFIIFGVTAAIAIAVWSARTGARKGYGLLASLSANPFLLNELPARPGSEEAMRTRVPASKQKRSSGRKKPSVRTARAKTTRTPRPRSKS